MALKKYYRLNQNIQSDKVRIIDEEGKQLGVKTLGEALFLAGRKNLDLVEVAGKAEPPVCKLIDFQKFRYQEQKKSAAGRKKGKGSSDQKEIRMTPFMGKKDYEDRVKKARKFLEGGHRVKLVVKFFGRQITRKEFGYKQLENAVKSLSDISKAVDTPKWQGRLLSLTLKPTGNILKKE